jgi:hypothetical protein
MPDCFISYSSNDQLLANFIHSELTRQNLSVFMASVSLRPGEDWTEAIKSNLKASSWIILLASRAACRSAFVLQETGMALATDKRLIPILWDINPSELPGWVDRRHALNLKGATLQQIQTRITELANMLRTDKTQGDIIAGVMIFGLFWLASRS